MAELIEKQTVKQAIKPPSMWNVIFHNDDFTSFEFVMLCLMSVFSKTEEQAFTITKEIHSEGKGVVGQYPRDIAETKKETAIDYARKEGFPLLVEIQPN